MVLTLMVLTLTVLTGPAVAQQSAPTPSTVGVQPRASGAVLLYVDDNHTQVVKTTTAGRVTQGATSVSATVGFDFITAASVDLITAASPRGFEERRTQVDGAVEQNLGEGTRLNGGYNLSHEPDYLTHALRIGGQTELFARHLILSGGYGLSLSEVGRRNDSVFSEQRQGHTFSLSATRIVTRMLAVDVSYSLALVRGFQSNAYRYVRLFGPDTASSQHITSVAEHTPNTRARHALVGRLRWRMLHAIFLHASYRGYVDTWGMTAHTGTVRALWSPGGGVFSLALRGRGHSQGPVDFYRARYDTFPDVPTLRTADKELGPMWTALVGAHLEWSPRLTWVDALHVGAGADWLHIRYLDYAYLSRRNALLVTLDLTLEL